MESRRSGTKKKAKDRYGDDERGVGREIQNSHGRLQGERCQENARAGQDEDAGGADVDGVLHLLARVELLRGYSIVS